MGAVSEKTLNRIRILVVDDHPLVREALSAVINRHPEFVCCGEAASAAETLKAVAAHSPDLVLLDLWLDKGDGLELIKTLRLQHPALRILVLSQFEESVYAERALRAGARGYVMKEQASKEVVAAMQKVLAGELYVSPKMAAIALHKLVEPKNRNGAGSIEGLTDRELQIFELLGAGMSTRRIADSLSLSFKTIETHRENIKHKLGLRDAAELTHSAANWRRGLRPSVTPE